MEQILEEVCGKLRERSNLFRKLSINNSVLSEALSELEKWISENCLNTFSIQLSQILKEEMELIKQFEKITTDFMGIDASLNSSEEFRTFRKKLRLLCQSQIRVDHVDPPKVPGLITAHSLSSLSKIGSTSFTTSPRARLVSQHPYPSNPPSRHRPASPALKQPQPQRPTTTPSSFLLTEKAIGQDQQQLNSTTTFEESPNSLFKANSPGRQNSPNRITFPNSPGKQNSPITPRGGRTSPVLFPKQNSPLSSPRNSPLTTTESPQTSPPSPMNGTASVPLSSPMMKNLPDSAVISGGGGDTHDSGGKTSTDSSDTFDSDEMTLVEDFKKVSTHKTRPFVSKQQSMSLIERKTLDHHKERDQTLSRNISQWKAVRPNNPNRKQLLQSTDAGPKLLKSDLLAMSSPGERNHEIEKEKIPLTRIRGKSPKKKRGGSRLGALGFDALLVDGLDHKKIKPLGTQQSLSVFPLVGGTDSPSSPRKFSSPKEKRRVGTLEENYANPFNDSGKKKKHKGSHSSTKSSRHQLFRNTPKYASKRERERDPPMSPPSSPKQVAGSRVVGGDTLGIDLADLSDLIAVITHETNYEYREVRRAFLLTYRRFSNLGSVISALKLRWRRSLFEYVSSEVVRTRRDRIVEFMKIWMTYYFCDFLDPEAESLTLNFLAEIEAEQEYSLCEPLTPLFVSLKSSFEVKETAKFTLPPADLLWDKFSPEQLARMITYEESQLFSMIPYSELLDWNKRTTSLCPKIHAMINFSTRFSSWVTSELVKRIRFKERIKLLEKFIELGDALIQLNNLSSCKALIGGLTNSACYRLKKTWAEINPDLHKKYDEMNDLLSFSSSYAALRSHLKTVSGPCIPYIGAYLGDLTFLDDGNKDVQLGCINFKKWAMVSKVLIEFNAFQTREYSDLSPVQSFSKGLDQVQILTEEESYNYSKLAEPADPEIAIEKLLKSFHDSQKKLSEATAQLNSLQQNVKEEEIQETQSSDETKEPNEIKIQKEENEKDSIEEERTTKQMNSFQV